MPKEKKFNKYDVGQRVYFYKEDTKEYGYGYISCIVGVSETKNCFIFKYIVNDFIYCNPGIYKELEGFEELRNEGILTDYCSIRPFGFEVRGVFSSSDRVAGITVAADTIEEFNEKHRKIVDSVKIIGDNGEDIMRHDLLPDLK